MLSARSATPPRAAGKLWALLSYLLALVASIIAPLIIYLVKKDESGYVRFHAAQALNLGLTAPIYGLGLVLISIPVTILTHGFGLLLIIPAFIAYVIAHLVYLILAAVKANQGELYRIPGFICLRMVR